MFMPAYKIYVKPICGRWEVPWSYLWRGCVYSVLLRGPLYKSNNPNVSYSTILGYYMP